MVNGPLLGWPVLTGVLVWLSKRKTAEAWEAWALKSPVGSLLIELLAAFGLDIPKAKKALLRYTARKAGQIPADAVRASSLPEPLKKVLENEAMRKLLMDQAEKLLAASDPPAGAPRSPGSTSDAGAGSAG